MICFEVLSPSPFALDYLANVGIKSLTWINFRSELTRINRNQIMILSQTHEGHEKEFYGLVLTSAIYIFFTNNHNLTHNQTYRKQAVKEYD